MRFSPRARRLLWGGLGLFLIGSAALLYLIFLLFTAPPPPFQPRRAIAYTDVNPFGATFFLEREVEAWKRERTVKMAREAGIGWARQQFIWAEIEPQPGVFNWSKYDEIVDLFRRHGIQIIARLDRPPGWARSRASATGSSGPPDDFDTYGRFVAEFVQRYRGRVNYLQIWNEPNLAREWNDAPIDPAAYTQLLKIAFQRAKAIDPNVRILSAPLAITLGEPYAEGSPLFRNMNDLQFLEEMYLAGAKEYFDILSANAFGLGSPPDDPPNPGKLNFQRVALERQVMERFGDADKAVWILEYGWNAAPESIPDSRLIWGRVTEEQQAQYTVQGIELARQKWDWVGVFCIWFFRQVGDILPANPEYYFRMVDVDFAPRPVYFSVSAAARAQQVASPGEYEETHPALTYDGDWLSRADAIASGRQWVESQAPEAGATLRFYGDGLDLLVRRHPSGGRLLITIDGESVPGLPRDANGQTYVEQANARDEWRVRVPIARNLALREHRVEIRAEGKANLDGFVIPALAPPQPPWLWLGGLCALGLICLTFFARSVLAPQRG